MAAKVVPGFTRGGIAGFSHQGASRVRHLVHPRAGAMEQVLEGS